MIKFDKTIAQSIPWYSIVAGAAVILLATAPAARSAVLLTPDPDIPDSPAIETIDPEGFDVAQRSVIGVRELRQTFQNPAEFVVSELVLALNLNGEDGGLVLDFYEVADVNADNWLPLGGPIQTIILPLETDLPDTALRLGLTLTESSAFTLPARNTAAEGYGIEISNVDEVTNVGLIRHSNTGMDDFVGGKYYDENGGAPGGGNRDWGVWFVGEPRGGDYNATTSSTRPTTRSGAITSAPRPARYRTIPMAV